MMQREVKDTPLLEGKLSDLVTDMLYDPEQVTSSLDLNVLISKMGQRSVLPETRHEGLMQEGAGAPRGRGGCAQRQRCAGPRRPSKSWLPCSRTREVF